MTRTVAASIAVEPPPLPVRNSCLAALATRERPGARPQAEQPSWKRQLAVYRRQSKATVAVARRLVDGIDLPGKIFAHIALAVGRALPRRQRNIVRLIGNPAHPGFERQAGLLPCGGPPVEHPRRPPCADFGGGKAGDDPVF